MGYGSGSFTPSIFTAPPGTFYSDNIRAKVTNFSTSSLTTANIDLPTIQGGTINSNDKLLIIQMKGNGIGTHQAVVVTSKFGNTYAIQSVSGQNMLIYNTFAANDRVQVIKITEYYDFTLNGGLVTCHPWDDNIGTGGVLALMVSNNLNIVKGLISVAGKGFSPDEAGISWGVGSNGGAANATINLKNAAISPPSFACLDGHGTIAVNQGDKGGVVGASSAIPSVNSGTPIYYGSANKNTLLVMGDPGYYQTSYGGGSGGQGGGWGGQGANSNATCVPNAGTAGLQGINGLIGGNAGKGGHGGGAMIIKAFKINISVGSVVFDASGEPGQPGGNGGYGGAGGKGGDGGPGCCDRTSGSPNPIPQGGNGGYGDTGAGGKGGDAGNGGACGYIWIGTASKISTPASPRSKNFGYNAGKGGKAGFGGCSAVNTTPNNMSAKNECTGTNCTTAGGGASCAANVCNPDYAMCLLASTTTFGTAVGANDIDFKNSVGTLLGKYISKNTTGDGDLEMYVYNCSTPTVYKAICKGDCDVLFKQIAKLTNVNTDYLPSMPVGGTTCSTSLSFPFNINFIDQFSGNIPLLAFNHADINTPATLTDKSGGSDHVGTFTSCFSLQGPGDGEEYFNSPYNPAPVQAPAGNPGVAGPAPTPPATGGVTPPATDNVIIDEGNSWFTSGVNTLILNNAFSAIAYPNPADKDLNIELESEINITANVTVKDINGKEVITTKQKLQSGKNKFTLDVAKLKAGLYLITINANNKQSLLKVTIQ